MKYTKMTTYCRVQFFSTMIMMMVVSFVCSAGAYEGRRDNSILLNGRWQFTFGDGNEHAEVVGGQRKLTWEFVTLPGPFLEWNENAARTIKFIWIRRTFNVSRTQTQNMAVLRWNRIAFGATAFINGVKVGQNEPTGPYQTVLPEGVLKAGQNEIVLLIPGTGGVRKSKSGYFLIPAGFATNHRRGMPVVADDIWIDFSNTVYMKWVLAIPDPAKSKVTFRVTPVSNEQVTDLKISAQVKLWPDGQVVGRNETSVHPMPTVSVSDPEHFYLDVPIPAFKPWTYEECNLYMAHVQLIGAGKILDELDLRFGMRTVEVADANYKLNGRDLWLRGSNLVFEWD